MANQTGNFLPADTKWEMRQVTMLESVAMAEGAAVSPQISSNDVTGKLTLSPVENAAGADFFGILAEPIVATDSDYATAFKEKSVWVPMHANARAYFSVGAGTFTTADVFRSVELHSDSVSLAVDTAGKGAQIVGYISSTRGICSFNMPKTETA